MQWCTNTIHQSVHCAPNCTPGCAPNQAPPCAPNCTRGCAQSGCTKPPTTLPCTTLGTPQTDNNVPNLMNSCCNVDNQKCVVHCTQCMMCTVSSPNGAPHCKVHFASLCRSPCCCCAYRDTPALILPYIPYPTLSYQNTCSDRIIKYCSANSRSHPPFVIWKCGVKYPSHPDPGNNISDWKDNMISQKTSHTSR